MSRVDVVVPCYNYARFLRRAVDSVLDQPGVDVRVLVIDDTSTDETPTVGAAIAREDSRVEFRRHDVNRGHIATYNEGLIGWAEAEYTLLLSADDAVAPGALARATRVMERHPDVGLVYGLAMIVGDEDIAAPPMPQSNDYRVLSSSHFMHRCCVSGNPVPTPTALVRTRLQQQVGGYRADLPHTGDMEMWMRFALHGPVAVLRAVQAYYRWHSGNMSSAYYNRALSDQRERFRACSDVVQRWGQGFEEAGEWLAAASRRIGEEAFWLGSRAFDRGQLAESEACVAFALDVYPQLRQTASWKRFRLKSAVGARLWRLARMARRSNAHRSSQGNPQEASKFVPGQLNGWWPEPLSELDKSPQSANPSSLYSLDSCHES